MYFYFRAIYKYAKVMQHAKKDKKGFSSLEMQLFQIKHILVQNQMLYQSNKVYKSYKYAQKTLNLLDNVFRRDYNFNLGPRDDVKHTRRELALSIGSKTPEAFVKFCTKHTKCQK